MDGRKGNCFTDGYGQHRKLGGGGVVFAQPVTTESTVVNGLNQDFGYRSGLLN